MKILGINAFHGDASAALLVDGTIVAAAEEERFRRVKHWAGFPSEAIKYCLSAGHCSASDLDHVAISFNPKANVGHKLLFSLTRRPEIGSIIDRLKRQGKATGIRESLAGCLGVAPAEIRAEFHQIEHHAAHLATAYLLSPFQEASILSIDGMGDFVSTMTATGKGDRVSIDQRHYYPHSLGFLYNAITLYLGFPSYGDEYKVMGLAAYGEPEYLEFFRRVIQPKGDFFELNLDYFTHHKKGIEMSWDEGAPVVSPFHSALLEKELGPTRRREDDLTRKHEDIAASVQAVTEEIIFHTARQLYRKHPSPNLCLAGGVAMNSVANGKLHAETPFERIYIPAGAADNGTSFGAASWLYHQDLGMPRSYVMNSAALGPTVDDDECRVAAESQENTVEKLGEDDLIARVVELICDGKVVGWYQGRMEFGARALGHRSLVADPRRADMRDIINLKIKFREKFRPFAPSVLREHVGEWFESDVDVPFMEMVLPIRKEKHSIVPAVTHVDGTGRLQTVTERDNPLYHKLISKYFEKTGVPMVLNTSLNENEPIVNTAKQALDCFLRTSMDAIALGPYLVIRSQ